MKITLEFTDAERFMKELPQFAKVIGFASQFVQFSRTGKRDGDVDIQADVPNVVVGPDGEHLAEAGDAKRVIDAAKKVGKLLAERAAKAGVTAQSISRIEKGENAGPATAKKISDALGIPVDELFTINAK